MDSRLHIESIEDSEPGRDDVSPPDRFDDIVLSVEPYDPLFVAGHPIRCELFQKLAMRDERWVNVHSFLAAIKELVRSVTVSR